MTLALAAGRARRPNYRRRRIWGEVGALFFAVLGPWQHFTGYCVLVSRAHATELSRLGLSARSAFLSEMALLAEAIEGCFRPHKLNYELLGNQVPHLHWHLFPRSAADPDRLRPVWFALEKADADPAEKRRLETGTVPRAEAVARLREWLRENYAPTPEP